MTRRRPLAPSPADALVLAYCRQSEARPGETEENSLSLDHQESALRAWSARHALTLVAVVRDHDLTGDDPARPGVDELRRRLAAGQARNVVVYKWDRFARDLLLQESIIRPLEARGVRFHSATEPGDRLSRVIFGGIAEHFKAQHAERLAGVFAERASRGLWHGEPCYGFRKVPLDGPGGTPAPRPVKVLVPDEQTAPVVAWVYGRWLAPGATLWGIANDLTARGVPAPRGGAWSADAVRLVLTNPAYAGDVRYGGEVVARDAHPPLVDRATWDAAQAKLAGRAVVKRHPGGASSWLEGLVLHSCGRRMYLTRSHHHDKAKPPTPSFGCGSAYEERARRCGLPRRHVVVAKLEPAVRACLAADLASVLSVEEAVAAAEAAAGGDGAERARRTLAERRRLAEHRHGRARERWLAGREPMSWMDAEDARCEAELAAIAGELAVLPAAPDPERFAEVAERLASLRGLLARGPDPAVREVLATAGVAVVSGEGVTIAYRPELARFVPAPAVIEP